MNERILRARAVLSSHATVVVVALLAVAAVGGVLAYDAHADPGTRAVERSVDEWRLDGQFQHGARVTATGAGTPFEPNSTVENREVYFERVMPVLSGEFVLAYDGTGPVRLHLDRRFVVESVASDAGSDAETVYWRRNRSLGSATTSVAPGERATAAFAVNVSDAHREARNVSERLESPGEIRTRIVVDVEASRGSEGAPNRTVSFALPIESERGVYRVGDGSGTERFNRTETATVPAEPGPLRSTVGPLALLVGLAGVVGVGLARRRGHLELSTVEREWLRYRTRVAEYDEWISEGRVPDDALDRPAVVLDALDALVDVAIDTDERVLHDVDRGSYHVLDDDVRYVYETPERPWPDTDAEAASDADQAVDDALASGDGSTGEISAVDDVDSAALPFGDEDARDPDAVLDDGIPGVDVMAVEENDSGADAEEPTVADGEETAAVDGED
ncbi:DUF5305 domain-containing protein [Halorubellus sp. JP-L1]|uniref:DUF5305 domain-containing protein n=1 Tax=Halorubellus sp. JP-L1 TaxID=2715753 RepID=UPI001408A754|nr:DUF5305 domain-containing protein [Halorubellus sp. JP-L1]NHN41808.1 DUF5305 domain-containing protein [Halorubellus sp. JP-L1]